VSCLPKNVNIEISMIADSAADLIIAVTSFEHHIDLLPALLAFPVAIGLYFPVVINHYFYSKLNHVFFPSWAIIAI
jgi:hypothetical protein